MRIESPVRSPACELGCAKVVPLFFGGVGGPPLRFFSKWFGEDSSSPPYERSLLSVAGYAGTGGSRSQRIATATLANDGMATVNVLARGSVK